MTFRTKSRDSPKLHVRVESALEMFKLAICVVLCGSLSAASGNSRSTVYEDSIRFTAFSHL